MSGEQQTLWTTAKKVELARYLAAGDSYATIGDRMGLTKGQIAGQAHRLKLRSEGKTPQNYRHRAKKPKTPRTAKADAAKKPALGHGDCRFIAGEPDWTHRGDAIYCGEPVQEGSSWCPVHHSRCTYIWRPGTKIEDAA